MKELCDMRDALLWMHNAVSLLIKAIESDSLAETQKRYQQIVERDADDMWFF